MVLTNLESRSNLLFNRQHTWVLCLYEMLCLVCYGGNTCAIGKTYLFLFLRHDKLEIGVINVSQPPIALLFASLWAPKRPTTALTILRLMLLTKIGVLHYSFCFAHAKV